MSGLSESISNYRQLINQHPYAAQQLICAFFDSVSKQRADFQSASQAEQLKIIRDLGDILSTEPIAPMKNELLSWLEQDVEMQRLFSALTECPSEAALIESSDVNSLIPDESPSDALLRLIEELLEQVQLRPHDCEKSVESTLEKLSDPELNWDTPGMRASLLRKLPLIASYLKNRDLVEKIEDLMQQIIDRTIGIQRSQSDDLQSPSQSITQLEDDPAALYDYYHRFVQHISEGPMAELMRESSVLKPLLSEQPMTGTTLYEILQELLDWAIFKTKGYESAVDLAIKKIEGFLQDPEFDVNVPCVEGSLFHNLSMALGYLDEKTLVTKISALMQKVIVHPKFDGALQLLDPTMNPKQYLAFAIGLKTKSAP